MESETKEEGELGDWPFPPLLQEGDGKNRASGDSDGEGRVGKDGKTEKIC